MKRKIEFRFWDKRDKRWYPVDGTDGYDILNDNRFIVQQSTGVADKKGRKIYEGDILAVKFNGSYVERISWDGPPDATAVVFWDYHGFRLFCKGDKDARYADWFDVCDSFPRFVQMSSRHTEVIGNIYENPQLAKEITGRRLDFGNRRATRRGRGK